jgi:hypothetical protein
MVLHDRRKMSVLLRKQQQNANLILHLCYNPHLQPPQKRLHMRHSTVTQKPTHYTKPTQHSIHGNQHPALPQSSNYTSPPLITATQAP